MLILFGSTDKSALGQFTRNSEAVLVKQGRIPQETFYGSSPLFTHAGGQECFRNLMTPLIILLPTAPSVTKT
jgi:hypothetical protein